LYFLEASLTLAKGKNNVPYSFIRHIAKAVMFYQWKTSPIAMFSSYLDASGNQKMSVLTVSGFVARVSKWERFERKWAGILDRYGVSLLHMTDFASSKGQFASWKGDTEKRKAFIANLMECISEHTNKGFAASVPISEYREINKRYMVREHLGSPYGVCAFTCLDGIRRWARKRDIPLSSILTLIEDGDEDRGRFIEMARSYGFKVVPLKKEDAHAFQAGDLVSWKTRTALHNSLSASSEDEGWGILRSLQPISKALNIKDNKVLTEEAMARICHQSGILPRPLHAKMKL
jgi:hypothetical protein